MFAFKVWGGGRGFRALGVQSFRVFMGFGFSGFSGFRVLLRFKALRTPKQYH